MVARNELLGEEMVHKIQDIRMDEKNELTIMEGKAKDMKLIYSYTKSDRILSKKLELLDNKNYNKPKIVHHAKIERVRCCTLSRRPRYRGGRRPSQRDILHDQAAYIGW